MNPKKFFNIFIGILIIIAVFTSAACSKMEIRRSSLSEVVFGRIEILGDVNDMAADAVREAFYLRGASYSPDAPPLVGRLEWFNVSDDMATRIKLQIRIENSPNNNLAAVVEYKTWKFYDTKVFLIRMAADMAADSAGEQMAAKKKIQ